MCLGKQQPFAAVTSARWLGKGEQETVLPEVTLLSVWLSQDSNLLRLAVAEGPV